MFKGSMTRWSLLAAMAALALVMATACGDDDDDDGTTATPSGGTGTPQATAVAPSDYNIALYYDFSGPFADVFKDSPDIAKALFGWWNDTRGRDLGVKLNYKAYDWRYDPAQAASLWPSVLSELHPVAALGVGGPDVAALQQRLPNDKVPLIMSVPGYGFGWTPNQWIFHPRPTYVHEMVGFLQWYMKEHPDKRPLRIGLASLPSVAAGADIEKGLRAYVDGVWKPAGKAELTKVVAIEIQPVDVSTQIKQLLDAKVDVIVGPSTTAQVAATVRALQRYGSDVPLMMLSHSGVAVSGRVLGGVSELEGNYEAYAMASAAIQQGEAYDFYTMLKDKYGLKAPWASNTVQIMGQMLVAARAVEHAAKTVGGDKVTGQAVYDALSGGQPFTAQELQGIFPELKWTKDAPFPTENLSVQIATVKDGKYEMAVVGFQPIPEDIKKW